MEPDSPSPCPNDREELRDAQELLANATQTATFRLADLRGHRPVHGAAITEIRPGGPVDQGSFCGFSDSVGRVEVQITQPKLRVLAAGYIPLDFTYTKTTTLIMTPLHPAAYSGFCPGQLRAIWVPEDGSGTHFEFTADGLMRSAGDRNALMAAGYTAYSLVKAGYWIGYGEPVIGKTDWCTLSTRDYRYPMNGKWLTALDTINQFRFPEPAVMVARNSSRKDREHRYKLYN